MSTIGALDGILLCAGLWLAIGAAGLAFPRRLSLMRGLLFPLGAITGLALAACALTALLGSPEARILPIGPPDLPFHVRVDALSAFFLLLLGAAGAGISIYAAGYLRPGEGTAPGLHCLLYHLFLASMVGVLVADDGYAFMVAWETMALSSYFLVVSEHRHAEIRRAGYLYLLIAHVGAVAILLAFGVLAGPQGDYTFTAMRAFDPSGVWPSVAFLLAVFGFGAKAGLLPLHVWLPDSMEGPTPISALIHAATMVTAGIFMVSRMSPLYELSDTALNFILVIGAITALFMGILGIIQNDIKRVIAYSTLSQLGYMTVALGASAYSVAVFHLMTHAFFKALLFLGAGSVIMGMHHNQDIRWMGGVRKYMPITWITFLLGNLALIGTPFFSGFYSKDAIIEAVHASTLPGAGFAYFAVLAGVFITAFYSFRLYWIVFHGQERYDQNPDAHHGHAHDDHHHGHDAKPHESPWVVTLPLVLLAIPSVVIGAIALMPMLFGDFFNGVIFVDGSKHPAMAELAQAIHGWVPMALHGFSAPPFWLALAGVVVSYVFYMVKPEIPAAIMAFSKKIGLYQVLEGKYGVDWVYENIFARGARAFGTVFWRVGDQALIDGAVVNGSWKVVGKIASVVRWFQSGYIYHYALVMILGVFLLMTYFVWLNK